MTDERLAELAEEAATGRLAELYADIRAVLGLPMVNLVYRHLATKPGLLEESWAALRPNLASRDAAAAAGELVAVAVAAGVAAVPRASLAAAGLTTGDASLARATLAAYRRANSRNLLGMCLLLDGCVGSRERDQEESVPPATPILPLASLETLTPAVAALLDELSLYAVGGTEPRIVPTLLRHFAGNGCLLALVWTALRPAAAAPARSGAAIVTLARELASALPYPVAALGDAEARAVAARFADAMARMLLLGQMLSAALAEA